ADERAATGGGGGGCRTGYVASVPPHSFVTPERSQGTGEDRARTARPREHLDDAQHLHTRRRRFASERGGAGRRAAVHRIGPKWSQISDRAENGHARKYAELRLVLPE